MSLNKLFNYLTGDYSEFSLEYRIFHSFCVVAIITLAYCVPLNLLLDLPISAWISLVAMLIQCGLFYLSRFRKKNRLSLILSIIIIHIILIVNYYYNSGIGGPTLLLLLAVLFLVVAVSAPKDYKYWITLNAVIALSLPLLEFFYPTVIKNLYVSEVTHFGDMVTTYFLCSLTMLMGLRYIKKNYYKSQELLEDKAKDLETINQTKNKMFSIISHDLRAPIASIQSYLDVLSEMDLDHKDRQQIKGELMQMTQNTDIMLSNLLMWSKSQMEGIVMDKKITDLAEVITPVLKIFQSIAAKKDVNLFYSIDPEVKVMADKDMLQLVIRNILSNSIKFTHPGGTINLKANCENLLCEIIISDSGIGMTEAIRESIFSVKAESSYGTKNEKGVGLGLNLSKEFTEMQNGGIRFETELDKGTTFYITMPVS
jgi:two-component system sensor histidine kinase/response regulator